MLTDIKCTTN